MKRLRYVAPVLGIVLACSFAAGCSQNAVDTCADLDDFMFDCYQSCAATLNCEANFDSLPRGTQLLLQDCGRCLGDSAHTGTCGDCTATDGVNSYSCFSLLTDHLGVACGW